jgi:fructose-bisphosphate aldolase class II
MADEAPVPVALHLDHCPEREWITACLEAGWSSVLFDGSLLDVEENTRQTREVVAEAREHGAQVEGEIETVMGVEDGVGSEEAGEVQTIEVSSRFIEATGVYSFAPAVGTAHGLYAKEPRLTPERITELVELQPIPMVLHGGTGLTPEQFQDCISRGCAKVNISTALRIAFFAGHREYLEANPTKQDPLALFAHVREAVKAMATEHIRTFGSAGRATARSAARARGAVTARR